MMPLSTAFQPIRILLANLAGVISQVIAAEIAAQPDMVMVGDVQGSVEVLMAVLDGVDVVVLGETQLVSMPGLCSHLLYEYPELKLLVYSADANMAYGYWLDIRRSRTTASSAEELIAGLRNLHGKQTQL